MCCPLAAAAPGAPRVGPALLWVPSASPGCLELGSVAPCPAHSRNSSPPPPRFEETLWPSGVLAQMEEAATCLRESVWLLLRQWWWWFTHHHCLAVKTQQLPTCSLCRSRGYLWGLLAVKGLWVKGMRSPCWVLMGWKGCHGMLCVRSILELGEEGRGKHRARKASLQVFHHGRQQGFVQDHVGCWVLAQDSWFPGQTCSHTSPAARS